MSATITDDVAHLSGRVVALCDRAGIDTHALHRVVTDPAAAFAAARAVGNGALAHNGATVAALRHAVEVVETHLHPERGSAGGN
jgi:hypothetical protein